MRHTSRALMLFAATAVLLAAQDDPPGRAARLNYITGPVSFQPAGVTDWVDATINRPLTTGDNLWVGDGARAELHVGSTALRLNSDTAFQFLNLNDQIMQISVSEGTLTVRLPYLGEGQNVEVDTPNMAFTLLRTGEYRIDANSNSQTTTVSVIRGQGEVTGGGQAFAVPPGQQAVISGDQQITYNVQGLPGPDDWDNWNLARDRREDHSVSSRYVSPEVTGNEDLDDYGRWSEQPGYGQVWMPSGVGPGWAPYHNGHWAWIAPWGWTWVDDAPWGFAPFHYGRWAYFGGGWGWCPGPIAIAPMYAPALVGWIGGGGGGFSFGVGIGVGVGWFPLGFGEPFIPGYRVSPGYFNRVNVSNTVINRNVNITNVYNNTYINNRQVTNINYANRNVNGAVTAVPQSAFVGGRSVAQSAIAVPRGQLGSARIGASPGFAPQTASVLGGRAASTYRPPASVVNRAVVARTPPPAPPVPFARQQAAIAQNGGRPLAAAQVQTLQRSAPAPQRAVRVMNPTQIRQVPTPAARPAPQNNNAARPQTQPAARTPAPQPATGGWRTFGEKPQPGAPAARPTPQQNTRPAPVEAPRQPQAQQPQRGWQQPARPPAPAQQQSRPQPQVARPQPQVARPQPQQSRPQPQEARPQPQEARPQPQQPRPQPQEVRPQPQEARPQPQQPRPQPQEVRPQPQRAPQVERPPAERPPAERPPAARPQPRPREAPKEEPHK